MTRVLGILAAAVLAWGCAPQGQGSGVRFASIDQPLSIEFPHYSFKLLKVMVVRILDKVLVGS